MVKNKQEVEINTDIVKDMTGLLGSISSLLKGFENELDNESKKIVKSINSIFDSAKLGYSIGDSIGKLGKAFVDLGGNVGAAQAAYNTFSTIMSPVGIGLIIGSVIGLSTAFANFIKEQTKANDPLREVKDRVIEQSDAFNELKLAEEANIESNMKWLAQAESYNTELKTLVDEEGKVIGSKERVAFLMEEINKIFPDAIELIEDETGAYITQSSAIDDLIEKKQAQVLLDSKEAAYIEALNGREEVYRNQVKLLQEKNELEAERLELQERWGSLSEDEVIKLGVLSSQIGDINQKMETNGETIAAYSKSIDDYEGLATAITTNDHTAIEGFLNGTGDLLTANNEVTKEHLQSLREQSELTKSEYETMKEAMENGNLLYNEQMLKNAESRAIQAEAEYQKAIQTAEENGISLGTTAVESMQSGWVLKEAGFKETTKTVTDNALTGVTESVNAYESPEVVIPVRYEYQNSLPSGGYGSYTDSGPGPFTYSMGLLDDSLATDMVMRANAQANIQQSLIGLSSLYLSGQGIGGSTTEVGSETMINGTTINFNQPIQSPAQVTRAMKKVAQDLVKGR